MQKLELKELQACIEIIAEQTGLKNRLPTLLKAKLAEMAKEEAKQEAPKKEAKSKKEKEAA